MDCDSDAAAHSAFASLYHGHSERWLRDEVTLVQAQLQKAFALLNAFVPACSLPEEILLQIFGEVQTVLSGNPSWMVVMHVCQVWRNTGLNSPSLWSWVQLQSIPYVLACLERSKDVPLRIYHDQLAGMDLGQYVKMLRPHVGRMLDLDFKFSPSRTPDDVQALLSSRNSWSKLRSLALTADRFTTGHFTPVPLAISLDVLSNHSPQNLRILRLDGITLSSWTLNMSMYRNIQTLHLLHLSGTHRVHRSLSLNNLLGILEGCSLLEHFHIVLSEFNDFEDDAIANSRRQAISLCHLRSLVVALRYRSHMSRLLSHLLVPEDVHVHLHRIYFYGLEGRRDFTNIAACLPSDPSSLRFTRKLSSVEFNWSKSKGIIINSIPEERPTKVSVPSFKFIYEGSPPANLDTPIQMALARLSPLLFTNVMALYLNNILSHSPSAASWGTFLSCFPSVRVLRIREALPLSWDHSRSLKQLFRDLSAPPGKSMALPSLAELHLPSVRRYYMDDLVRDIRKWVSPRISATSGLSSFELHINNTVWTFSE